MIEKVIYAYAADGKHFIGPANKEMAIEYLVKEGELGFDLTGWKCSNCGFIFAEPHKLCEWCDYPRNLKQLARLNFLARALKFLGLIP